MEGYDVSTYGDRIAALYDGLYDEMFDKKATVALLVELAGGGPALELAIGTGRIAIPLSQHGIEVKGIDVSEEMIARLREKPGGEHIEVAMGDFADMPIDGEYPLIYLVFNTFFGLFTQEDQVRCFANVARHLTPGGVFVLECFVPDTTRFDRDQRVDASEIHLDKIILDVSRHDSAAQTVTSQHVVIQDGKIETYPVHMRYAWPSELDLMARLAGLRLRDRWSGWKKEPFGPDSEKHVSVYERPA